MTTNIWKNAAGGLWSAASNWSNGAVPVSTDDAVIGVASGVTVELPSGLGNSGTTNGSSIYALKSVTITGGRLLVDAGEFLNLGSLSTTPSIIGQAASLDIKGEAVFSRSSSGIGGAVTVESGGTLVLGSPNTPTAGSLILAPSANVTLAKGGTINVNQNVPSAALTAFAGQITPSGQATGTTPVGSTVTYAGNIANAGAILDLTAGGPLAAITSFTTSNQTQVTGGTIVNSGKFAVPLAIPNLVNVTLKGPFTIQPALGGLYISVTDGLAVLNLDGSPGTLDLATASADLEVGSSTTNPVTLNGMTINVGPGIESGTTLILGPSTTTNFSTMNGHFSGAVINQGVVNLGGVAITVTLGLPAGNSTPGSFENDGTIAVGAGDTLVAGSLFTNKGTLTMAAGGTAIFAGGAAGAIALAGTGDTLSFGPSGPGVAAISGFRAGDVITAGVGNGIAATLALTGQTLTVQQAGTTLATLALSDAGQAAYSMSDFGITTASNGTVTVTTTHAAGTTGAMGSGGSAGGGNGGQVTVSGSGNNVTVAMGVTATTGTGGNRVTVSSSGAVVSNGPDTVFGGTGATTVTLNGSGATVVGNAGPLTVSGGPGNNTVFAGPGGLTYIGGAGLDTVVGGGKPVMATAGGGSGGAEFFGGGNAVFSAGQGTGLNLEVGGNGDQLYAAGPNGVLFGTVGGDTLMSSLNDTGSSVFFGAGGSGHMTFITGAGSDILALGQGTNTVTLGSGHDVIFANGGSTSVTTIQAGAGSLDLAFSGASTVLDIAAGMARAFNLYAYAPGADTIHLQGFSANEAANAIATQRSVAGGTQLSLGDGSVISLIGVSHATGGLFS